MDETLKALMGQGVIGIVAIISFYSLYWVMNKRDEENKAHRLELIAALEKKDATLEKKDTKLQGIMEDALRNNTIAMLDNAQATRENTKVLQAVPCVTKPK